MYQRPISKHLFGNLFLMTTLAVPGLRTFLNYTGPTQLGVSVFVFIFFIYIFFYGLVSSYPPPAVPRINIFLTQDLSEKQFSYTRVFLLTGLGKLLFPLLLLSFSHLSYCCVYICLIMFNLRGVDSSVPPASHIIAMLLYSWFFLNWPTLWDRVRI